MTFKSLGARDGHVIRDRIEKLRERIKNTSSTRFAASKRVKFNYSIANLTIVVLSLWAITISFTLTVKFINLPVESRNALEVTGVILPVFIVVFSLIEGGENFLRSYQLEANARQLRELTDKFSGEIAKVVDEADDRVHANLFEKFSKDYNDILERSPINHDDVDHFGKSYGRKFEKSKRLSPDWWIYGALTNAMWVRRQIQRVFYFSLWLLPVAAYSRWPFPFLLDFFRGISPR